MVPQKPYRAFSRLVFDLLSAWHRPSRPCDPSGVRWPPWGRWYWCASNHRDHVMSSELETSQPELHLEALEIFLVGNRDLERQEALLDAHHLLRLRGSPTRTGSGSMRSAKRRPRSSCNQGC